MEAAQEDPKFFAGYSAVDITPEEPVPIAGFGNVMKRMSERAIDRLKAICIALKDGQGESVLLYTVDICEPEEAAADIRGTVCSTLGIPIDHVFVNASHTHSGPATNADCEEIRQYRKALGEKLLEAAKIALEDLAPAGLSFASASVADENFTRHYILPDGTRTGYDSGARGKHPVQHIGENDPVMQFLRFERENKKDILLVNWQGHMSRTGRATKFDMSADVAGVIRDEIESRLGVLCSYLNGASGNENLISLIDDEHSVRPYDEQGKDIVSKALSNPEFAFLPIKAGRIKTQQMLFPGAVNHQDGHLMEEAEKVRKFWTETNDRKATDEYAKAFGIRSPYHANAIVFRSKLGETRTIELDVLSMGEAAIFFGSYEMFSENALFVKRNSPFRATMCAGYSNENFVEYIPSIGTFSYEAYERDTTKFVPGTGERLAELFVEMLNEIK